MGFSNFLPGTRGKSNKTRVLFPTGMVDNKVKVAFSLLLQFVVTLSCVFSGALQLP